MADIYRDAGFDFYSLDLNEGNNSIPIDLNIWPNRIISEYVESFDMVLNFGTTEHVSNQMNAFSLLHYLCRPGGIIPHRVPMIHFSAHAMNLISPKFLEKLT